MGTPYYEIYEDKQGRHRFRYVAGNGRTIFISAQGYEDKRNCVDAIDMAKGSAQVAIKGL